MLCRQTSDTMHDVWSLVSEWVRGWRGGRSGMCHQKSCIVERTNMSPGARGNSSTRPGAPWTLGQIMVAVLLSVVVAEPTSSTFTGNVWAYGMHRPSLTSLLLQRRSSSSSVGDFTRCPQIHRHLCVARTATPRHSVAKLTRRGLSDNRFAFSKSQTRSRQQPC